MLNERSRPARALRLLVMLLLLASCALPDPPVPTTPRPTAQTILEITPAATQDVDATATSYARQLIPTPTPSGLYVVQPGDTLSALAEDFGTSVDEIMAANGLTDPNALQAGQTLIIPSLVQSSPAFETPLAGTGAVTPTVELTATVGATATLQLSATGVVTGTTSTATPTLSTP